MRNACVLGLLLGAIVTQVDTTGQRPSLDARPQAIFWPQRPDNPSPPTPVGLLYTPEVLAALAPIRPEQLPRG